MADEEDLVGPIFFRLKALDAALQCEYLSPVDILIAAAQFEAYLKKGEVPPKAETPKLRTVKP